MFKILALARFEPATYSIAAINADHYTTAPLLKNCYFFGYFK